MTTSQKREKVSHGLIIASFLALIWLPTWDWLWDLDHCPSPNENRNPAPFPGYFQVSGAYLTACNQFFDDHFGFRNQLVRWNTHWKLKAFKEAGTLVMEGKKGWLYYKREGMVENYTGQRRFTDADLQDWKTAMETRRNWLAGQGIKYIMVVAPNKESIYPEFLPKWMVRTSEQVKLEQFVSYMRTNSSVIVVDLRPSLLQAKQKEPTYFRTDTHWNNFGGFVGYQQIVQAAGIEPEPLEHFTQRRMPRTGDLAQCIDQADVMPETYHVVFEPKKPLAPLKQKQNEIEHWTRTENPAKTRKSLLLGDSFMDALIPFVGYSFKEVLFRHRTCNFCDTVAAEKPDLVIDEMVERTFNNVSPLGLVQPQEKLARQQAAARGGTEGALAQDKTP
jgi:alginate O-acetyltransferase complex protein AlgJ